VILCTPALNALVVKVAAPELIIPVPIAVPLSLNVTISPFGGTPPLYLTRAVNVMARPTNPRRVLVVTVVVVGVKPPPLVTVSVEAGDTLPTKLLSPE
jgi:hypothetical protein